MWDAIATLGWYWPLEIGKALWGLEHDGAQVMALVGAIIWVAVGVITVAMTLTGDAAEHAILLTIALFLGWVAVPIGFPILVATLIVSLPVKAMMLIVDDYVLPPIKRRRRVKQERLQELESRQARELAAAGALSEAKQTPEEGALSKTDQPLALDAIPPDIRDWMDRVIAELARPAPMGQSTDSQNLPAKYTVKP